MSDNVELKPIIQTLPASPNPEPAATETIVSDIEYSTRASGSENGGIYFELDWQTGLGQNRQQTLLTTYYGETPTEPIDYDAATVFTEPLADVSNGNSSAPISLRYAGNQNGYGDQPTESSFDYLGESKIRPNYYGVNANDPLSSFSPDDSNDLSWDDFISLISDSEAFAEFSDQTLDFWRDVRRLSETSIYQSDGGIETKSVSKYENLLTEMNAKKLSPDEYAETLPSSEREVFKARNRIDQTFGANIFESDGVTLNETGQNSVRQAAFESVQAAALPAKFYLKSNSEKPVFIDSGGECLLTRREIAVTAKNTETFTENTTTFPDSKNFEFGESKTPDKATPVFVGNNVNSVLAESGASRITGNAVSDNLSSVNSVVRRDSGAAMGGALINGSLASIDNYKNAENKAVGGSNSVGSINYDGGKSFAAGATGSMMSAAVGSLIPGSDANIGGVVGFISGVVVGAESDQGLRWLSGDRPTTITLNNELNSLEDNSFAPILQTVWA